MGDILQYYDVIPLEIVASLGLGLAVGALTPVSMPVAVVAFGGVAIVLIGHALFVNGPVDRVDNLAEAVEESPMEELLLVE